MDIKDSRDNVLQVGDRILFTCWGYNVALSEMQGTHEVVGFGRSRVRVRISSKVDVVKSVRPGMVVKVVDGKVVGASKW